MLLDIFTSIAVLVIIMLIAGLVLNSAARSLPADSSTLVREIMALLPQTQCGQCGYPGCRPYAEALAKAETSRSCPPGGQLTGHKLEDLLGKPQLFADASSNPDSRIDAIAQVAWIRETECIGCGFCKDACPVDAIIGSVQQMHTIIASECTGCDLCLEPCPVDCIEMHSL